MALRFTKFKKGEKKFDEILTEALENLKKAWNECLTTEVIDKTEENQAGGNET